MARMSNKRRLEWSFSLNDRSHITYNELYRKRQHECKQSFRVAAVDCPKYLSERSKKKDKTAGNGKVPQELRAYFYTQSKDHVSCVPRSLPLSLIKSAIRGPRSSYPDKVVTFPYAAKAAILCVPAAKRNPLCGSPFSSGFIEVLTHRLSADGLSLSYQQRT